MSRWAPENVYGTAKPGLRARAASVASGRARERRHAQLFALTGAGPGSRIVDIGCGRLGLRRHEPSLDITGVDLTRAPTTRGRSCSRTSSTACRSTTASSTSRTARASSSTSRPSDRAAFARELRRVARGWYVQTPAFSFPVEPHALLPFAHWLPPRLRRPYWRLGVAGDWEDIALLRRREMTELFGEPVAERAGPLVKSWVSVRPVPSLITRR